MEKLNKIKLIFGLGNFGNQFINTPHNFGRDLLSPLINEYPYYEDEYFKLGTYNNFYLAISKKYMNESGIVLKKILTKFKIKTEETLLIHDEADLPFLWLKLTFNKKASKHKGVESIYKICGNQIWRLRIGIQIGKRQKAENIILKKLDKKNLALWLKAKEKIILLLDNLEKKEIQKIILPKLFFLQFEI